METPTCGPWNPGLQSQVPKGLRPLATIFRAENTYTSLATVDELHTLTGIPPSELVAFRPGRLALHELLIRVTADFHVPDGYRVSDLGINFREIVNLVLERYIDPEMEAITAIYDRTRRELEEAINTTFDALLQPVRPAAGAKPAKGTRLFARIMRPRAAAEPAGEAAWGPNHVAECERHAGAADSARQRIVYRKLARVMSALFAAQGRAWGTRDLIVSMATNMACNDFGSECIGRTMEPLLARAAAREGYRLLPPQARPVVINTKGASASGKSTMRLLQKKLASDIGVRWNDFALISPDIWRKQLLDYASLGAAYKYAGAFAAEELQIIDQKLDRYMARKHERGEMTHLLIDRFRFDSFAPDSDQPGSNLLTRFGQSIYLFFMITPPEHLVERAWARGLEFGRFKAVDDTLAHAVEAYTGMPDVFFTWIRHSEKRIHFEFLDNTVPLGTRPRTVAFGDNNICNILNVKGMLDIERYGRVNVDAGAADLLYADPKLLEPAHNTSFLERCIGGFREVNFAEQASGRIYLCIRSGRPVWMDRTLSERAVLDADTRSGLAVVAAGALRGEISSSDEPRYLRADDGGPITTLGSWGA